jgi:hypothetical protein
MDNFRLSPDDKTKRMIGQTEWVCVEKVLITKPYTQKHERAIGDRTCDVTGYGVSLGCTNVCDEFPAKAPWN